MGESVTDEEILEAIHLLAQTEGIFTEPAGGTEVAVTKEAHPKRQNSPRGVYRQSASPATATKLWKLLPAASKKPIDDHGNSGKLRCTLPTA